jgi:hypothetical protein
VSAAQARKLALRDARKASRADHLDRRIPVLDLDFDNFAWSN